MKKLLAALFVALLMAGCGEDSKKPGGAIPESNQSYVETPPVKPTLVAKIDLNASRTPDDLRPIDDVLKEIDGLLRSLDQSLGTKDGSGNSPKNHNKDGDTPLDMAEGRGRTEIAKLLRDKGAKRNSD